MNEYYINGNGGFKSTLPHIHKNNYYVIKALNHLAFSSRDGKYDEIGGAFRTPLLSGQLPKSDKITGFNTNRLAEKLQFLVLQLSDRRHPENLVKFRNSFFYTSVLAPLFNGFVIDEDQAWENYQLNKNCEDALRGKNPIEGAFLCKYENYSSPIGLDFSKLIDTIVKTDKNGRFFLDDNVSTEDQLKITNAIQLQLDEFKENARFASNFKNPLLEAETNIENE